MKRSTAQMIELGNEGLTLREILQSLSMPRGALLRRNGCVIGRLQAVDQADLEDERWLRQPQQIRRIAASRRRFAQSRGIPLKDVERQLGLTKQPRQRRAVR